MNRQHYTDDQIHAAASTGEGLRRIVEHDLRAPFRQAGRELVTRSPFTGENGDRTPSFYLNPHRGVFKCWSTGRGGNWYKYLQFIRPNATRAELFALAAERLNIPELVILNNTPGRPPEPQERTTFYRPAQVTDRARHGVGVFETYVLDMFGEHGRQALGAYGVGCNADGSTNFWAVDLHGRVHGVKVTTYTLNSSGKPTKKRPDGRARVRWEFPKAETNVWRPAFGEHLLKGAAPQTVAIVEAEDTAVLLYAKMLSEGHRGVVLAAGGAGNYVGVFERLGVARGYMDASAAPEHNLFPDRDTPAEQLEALQEAAQRHAGVNLAVVPVERFATHYGYSGPLGPKYDPGDILHDLFRAGVLKRA